MPSHIENIEELLQGILVELRRFNSTLPLLDELSRHRRVVNDLEDHAKSVKISASRARKRWEKSQDERGAVVRLKKTVQSGARRDGTQ